MNSRTARRTVCLLAAVLAGGALIFKSFRPAAREIAAGPRVSSSREVARSPSAAPFIARTVPAPAAVYAPATAAPLAERDRGYEAIAALQSAGRFAAAAAFAAAGPPSFRRDWLIAAYFAWSQREPESALQAAVGLSDPASREIAVQSVWSGWAQADPAGLADAAMSFPDGSEKTVALTKALRSWMHADPLRAGDWVLAHHGVVPVAEFVFQNENR